MKSLNETTFRDRVRALRVYGAAHSHLVDLDSDLFDFIVCRTAVDSWASGSTLTEAVRDLEAALEEAYLALTEDDDDNDNEQ